MGIERYPILFHVRHMAGINTNELTGQTLARLEAAAQARRWCVIPTIDIQRIQLAADSLIDRFQGESVAASVVGLCINVRGRIDRSHWTAAIRWLADTAGYIRLSDYPLDLDFEIGDGVKLHDVLEDAARHHICVHFVPFMNHIRDNSARRFIGKAESLHEQTGIQFICGYAGVDVVDSVLASAAKEGSVMLCYDFLHSATKQAALCRSAGVQRVIASIDYDETEMWRNAVLNDYASFWDRLGSGGMTGLLKRLRQQGFSEDDIECLCCTNPRGSLAKPSFI